MKTIDEMISVMQACKDGKEIEYKDIFQNEWRPAVEPLWNWHKCDYRIKPVSEQKNIDDYVSTFLAYKVAYETDNAMAGYIERVCVENDPDLIKYKFNANKIAAALKKDMPMVPYEDENRYFCCPVCGHGLGYRLGSLQQTFHNLSWIKYCWTCGQKLDWESSTGNEESKV